MPNASARLDNLVPFTGTGASGYTISVGGYYLATTTYDDATHTINAVVPGLSGNLPIAVHVVAQLPAGVTRNRVDHVGLAINGGVRYLVYDQNFEVVAPSQLTPGQLVQWWHLVYGIGNVRAFVFADPLADRPQDYTIYASIRGYDAADPGALWVAGDFTDPLRSGSSDTNEVTVPGITVLNQGALAVPEVTGDIIEIYSSASFGNLLFFYTRQPGVLDIKWAYRVKFGRTARLYMRNRVS